MVSLSSDSNPLLVLSQALATAVEEAGRSVVAISASRQRFAVSGVHWRSGLIVTASHGLKPTETLNVSLPDGSSIPATLIGRDRSTDLAVLRIEAPDLPVASLGETTTLQVGHFVLAIARSGNRGLSASFGIVSALGGAWHPWGGSSIDQFLRLDLTLYPGFSGGPLVDAEGQVVGINAAGPRGMVLVLPIATVNRVVDQLLKTGEVPRGYLGLGMQPVRLPDRFQYQLQLQQTSGVLVVTVEPEGPGEQAGILLGDILIAVADQPVRNTDEIQALLATKPPGQVLRVQMIRGGVLTEIPVTLGERPHWED